MTLHAGPFTEESTSKYVEVDGVRIHYNEMGAGEPLICLSAWGEGMTSWFTYHRNVEELAKHYRVLLLDPIHAGRSMTPANDQMAPSLHREVACRYIKGFMDELDIDRAALIGTSTGGTTAICFGILFPERVTKLVISGCGISNGDNALLFNPVFYDEDGQIQCRQEGIKLGIAAMVEPTRANVEKLLKEGMVFDSGQITDKHIDYMFEVATDPVIKADRIRSAAGYYASYVNYNNLPDLWKFQIPTLFFHGRYDVTVSPEVAVQAVGLMPECRVVLLRCGHLVPFEMPEDFNTMTLGFLGAS
ncbi:alpha/beta fold hydrolase [Nocardia sp. R6R-6]|uniref:alpha/beta fold hydrolase n=1 Tax=Nocardia sp. R6R-6 TaxID=3459303 RepID=UPI00403E3589